MALHLETENKLPYFIPSSTKLQRSGFLKDFQKNVQFFNCNELSKVHTPVVTKHKDFKFTRKDLERCLYEKKTVATVDLERILRKRKLLNDTEPPSGKKTRILMGENDDDDELEDIEMTYSITSFPHDVQLCYSSISGYKYGVCSTKHIPKGAWIGPYEGKRVPVLNKHNSHYSWEVYKDGKLDHFLDGSDKHSSSWMRYIRCARNPMEQNMHVIQFGPNIFYRSFKAINPGEELLVWYEKQYEQHFGIPMFIKPSSFGAPPQQPSDHNHGTTSLQETSKKPQLLNYNAEHNIYNRQGSVGTLSPPLSTSPVQSPTTTTNADFSEDQEIGLWQCGQCHQRFTQRSALRIHVCPTPADNPYHCGHCNISFPDSAKLRDHVLTHNTERPFKCGFCSRTFAGATTLNNHVRTHTGQKPFTCEKCGKSFSQASQVSRHQRIAEDCHHRKD